MTDIKPQNNRFRIRVANTRRADMFFAGWSPSGTRAELTQFPQEAMGFGSAHQAADQVEILRSEPGVVTASVEPVQSFGEYGGDAEPEPETELEADPEPEEEQILMIARVAHEANRAYCEAIGDWTQPPWYMAPSWQVESACQGVRFHLENDMTPEQSHENWMRQKVADGWTWGPEKDPENKEHPCMVPYDMLPAEQQKKDHLFRAIVHALREA